MHDAIAVGDQVFVADGGEVFGAVRQVTPHSRPELVIYVENAEDFVGHCQVVGDDMVTRQQQALFGRDFHRPDA